MNLSVKIKKIAAVGLATIAFVTGAENVGIIDAKSSQQNPEQKVKKTRPVYKGRATTLDIMEENCFFPDEASHAKKRRNHAPVDLLTIFSKMQKDSITGKALANGAKEQDIAYCEVAPFDKGAGAIYQPDIGAVKIDWSADAAYNRRVFAHETLHGIQDGQRLLDSSYAWPQETWMRASLYTEAAAKVVEIMVGYEQKKKGDDEVWKELQETYADIVFIGPKTPDAFEAAYKLAKSQKKSDRQSLQEAGNAAWKTVFERKGWREFYITGTMGHTLGEMNGGEFDKIAFGSRDKDNLSRARISGYISDDFNFTSRVNPPSRKAIFKDLQDLERAFKALELARMKRAYGEKDWRVKKFQRLLLKERNPYIDIDWKKVQKLYDDTGDFKAMNEIMDEVLAAQKKPSALYLKPR